MCALIYHACNGTVCSLFLGLTLKISDKLCNMGMHLLALFFVHWEWSLDSSPLSKLIKYWWIWMNFHQSFEKCSINSHSRHQKTTSTLLRITLKGRLMVSNKLSIEGAMYIKILKILTVSAKQFTMPLEFIKLLYAEPISEFFYLH